MVENTWVYLIILKIKMDFKKCLTNIEYPKKKETWDIAGTIKGTNGFFKFDTRPTRNIKGEMAKKSGYDTKADKMVFEGKDQWIIVDVEELLKYLKEKKVKKVYLQELLSKLDWNIILPKN